jgi:hypothetical protein
MLLAIIAIASILIAVSTNFYLLMILGLVCFFIMYLLRFNQIGKTHQNLDKKNTDGNTDPTTTDQE